VLNFV